jgi:glycosyltransferase involved in cell wall biosynthesis
MMQEPVQRTKAVFVSNATTLGETKGGPSICTREFISTLRECGFDLTILSFESDKSLPAKLKRRIFNQPYLNLVSNQTIQSVIETVRQGDYRWMFLNFWDAVVMAPRLRESLPNVRIVHLSHGPESIDFLHELRSRDIYNPFASVTGFDEKRLSRQLIQECKQRLAVHDVICLSAVETEIERWLGAPRVTWLPRVVEPDLICWQPQKGRVGFVGSLEHPPNVEGLLHVLDEIERRNLEIDVRLVGGPTTMGKQLEMKYRCATYCGRLPENELKSEAATWNCFLHPIFCFARGASTKLATGLAWGIPIVTTQAGIRGYQWDDGELQVAVSPSEFVDMVAVLLANSTERESSREMVIRVAKSSPSASSVALQMSRFFGLSAYD